MQLLQVVRYYQAGVVNTLFGLGAYSALVWVGFGIYAAQLVSHLAGICFNYVVYRRHVFQHSAPAKMRFVINYLATYCLGLIILMIISQFVPNPYVSGIASALIVSVANYFFLKNLVFGSARS